MSEREEQPATDATTTSIVADGQAGAGAVRGTIRVAPEVLIELIELTVRDIEGVAELRSRPRRPKTGGEAAGKCYDDGKVRVVVLGGQIETDVAIAIQSGVSVAKVTADIHKQVARAVERMLGMTASAVNIYIDDVVAA